jgi:secondary thiamine-phosphate synthase enzyme
MRQIQETLVVATRGRGLVEVTDQVRELLEASGLQTGQVTVFCRHTSASLVLMENADPTARKDLEAWMARLVRDGDSAYTHDMEGPDDMASHLRMVITRTSETIPFAEGNLLVGTWQGLYLWEHRKSPHRRELVVHFIGE